MIHSDYNKQYHGTINFPSKLGRCKLTTETSESNIPYFNLESNFYNIKIEIFNSKYLKTDYILNEEEKRLLQDSLETFEDFNKSKWNWIKLAWAIDNENNDYPQKDDIEKFKIPNYLEL